MGLPKVEEASQLELAKRFVDEGETMQGYLSDNEKQKVYENLAQSLDAIYAFDSNMIYLGERVDYKTGYGRAVLVHELIHFLQNQYNHQEKVSCINALEKDAYTIQEQYMRANNMVPEFNKFTIMMRSICDQDM